MVIAKWILPILIGIILLLSVLLVQKKPVDNTDLLDSLAREKQKELLFIKDVSRRRQDSLKIIIVEKDKEVDSLTVKVEETKQQLKDIAGSYSHLKDDSLRTLMIHEFHQAKNHEKDN